MNTRIEEKFYSHKGNLNIINSVNSNSLTILDVGCGAGDNARILKGLGKTVDGITLSQTEAETARKYCRKVLIYDLENGLPQGLEEKYDAVICSHILEHLRYPEKVLAEIRLILKDEALLIVALPNIMGYRSRIKMILGKFEYEESGVMDYTHLRWYTFKSGKRLLEDNGYLVVKAWVDGGVPFGRITKFLNTDIQKGIKKILFSISPGFFSGELLYIARIK